MAQRWNMMPAALVLLRPVMANRGVRLSKPLSRRCRRSGTAVPLMPMARPAMGRVSILKFRVISSSSISPAPGMMMMVGGWLWAWCFCRALIWPHRNAAAVLLKKKFWPLGISFMAGVRCRLISAPWGKRPSQPARKLNRSCSLCRPI